MPSTPVFQHVVNALLAITTLPSPIQRVAAWLWIGLLLGVSLVYAVRLLQRSDYGPWEKCLYLPTYLFGRILWRVHFTNEPPPEIASGAILVANHRSSVDPFFVQLAARRRVHWMVAQEYCKHFLFGPLLRQLQVIPTNRAGTDTASTRNAIRMTRQGRLVGMFPEGRINTTRQLLLPLRSGAGVVSARASAPLIPLLIEGSPYRPPHVWSPIFMPAHVRITFGKAIVPNATGGIDEDSSSPDVKDCNGFQKPGRRHEPKQIDEVMLAWGRQIAGLARQPDFYVQLASARSRRRKGTSQPAKPS